MFEQHPVPQNISSYQFHLVGDMTLKQFLELAAGVVVGVIFYATALPGFIKWPLILFSGATGAALAFVPFEERPLEQWIIAFMRSVYSPTLFYWKKQQSVKYFAPETTQTSGLDETKQISTSSFAKIPFLAKLEERENLYLSKLTSLFNPVSSTPPSQPQTTPMPTAPAPAVQAMRQPAGPTLNIVNISSSLKPSEDGNILTMHTQGNTGPIVPAGNTQPRDVQIPQTTFISLDKATRPQVVVQELPNQQKVDLTPTSIGKGMTGQVAENANKATFSTQAAPPSLPTIINTVSGQVMDSTDNIIEGAILEIRDMEGRPVRALRTNRAGHFLIVTQLSDGKYQLVVEKEGYSFDPIEFEAKGQIIEPIAIHAK